MSRPPSESELISQPAAPLWVLHPERDPARAADLARDLGVPLPVANVLVNRGVRTAEAANAFLNPALSTLHDPGLLADLDRALERIQVALAGGERILVHGDYDVDGITSTFLMFTALRDLGADVRYRIPHRTRDGYGLSVAAIEEAHREGCSLIVTVDCGITANEAVERASALGIDCIITDHHEPPAVLPAAAALVNPNRRDCNYPFKSLAGVGVAYKVVSALLAALGKSERSAAYLDVVALGTIADVVPLVGENRVLARHGLDRLNASAGLGLRALIDAAGLSGRRITSGQIAFVLAPRMNAAGRMGHAEQGLRLLLARDADEARAYAQSLEEDNTLRREHDEQVLVDAVRMVETELDWRNCASILLWSERWHPGVIGIVASRLVERFQRPTFLIALDGERGRGSGRSLPGVDLNEVLTASADLLDAYGGHAIAAGLTVQRGRLPALRERFEALVAERLAPEQRVARLRIDDELAFDAIGLPLIDWLERLTPYGLGNREPVFATRDVRVESATAVGGGKHLKLRVRDASGPAEAIGFGLGDQARGLASAGRIDLAYSPIRDDWMGQPRVQLRVKGVRTR